jgi:hypothetical protein
MSSVLPFLTAILLAFGDINHETNSEKAGRSILLASAIVLGLSGMAHAAGQVTKWARVAQWPDKGGGIETGGFCDQVGRRCSSDLL